MCLSLSLVCNKRYMCTLLTAGGRVKATGAARPGLDLTHLATGRHPTGLIPPEMSGHTHL